MALSGIDNTLLALASTISALALYPERIFPPLMTCTAAFTSNWLAPLLSTALGDTYSRFASNERSCNAPMVIFIGIPSTNRPTSVSSIFPRKIRSFIFATVAIVVPSLKVLLSTTVLPTFTGTSRMRPVIVERMSVELALALLFDTPFFTTSRASCAATTSSFA